MSNESASRYSEAKPTPKVKELDKAMLEMGYRYVSGEASVYRKLAIELEAKTLEALVSELQPIPVEPFYSIGLDRLTREVTMQFDNLTDATAFYERMEEVMSKQASGERPDSSKEKA